MSKKEEARGITPYRGYRPVPKQFYEAPEVREKTDTEVYKVHRSHSMIIDKHLCDVYLTLSNLEVDLSVSKHSLARVDEAINTFNVLKEQLDCLEADIHNYQDMAESHAPEDVQKQFMLTPRRKIRYFNRTK